MGAKTAPTLSFRGREAEPGIHVLAPCLWVGAEFMPSACPGMTGRAR
jgi:hypothetical protein